MSLVSKYALYSIEIDVNLSLDISKIDRTQNFKFR